MALQSPQRISFCGITVDAMNQQQLVHAIELARSKGERHCIFHHNLHSVYLFQRNSEFRQAYDDATHIYVDGMPVVWLARAAGRPMSVEHRITFLDSFGLMLRAAETNGWRVFYLGSSEGVLQDGLLAIRKQFPDLAITGRNGFFDKSRAGSQEVIREINSFNPDVLFVGMGMPIQELWLKENIDTLHVAAALTCGATLDYVTGAAYKPPAWAGPLGLYGVFRMFSDPARLWSRYLLEPLYLSACVGPRLIRERIALLAK